jgi:hypothetical protein
LEEVLLGGPPKESLSLPLQTVQWHQDYNRPIEMMSYVYGEYKIYL